MKSSSPAGTAPGGVPAPWNGSRNGDAGAKGVGVVASASASARSEVDASVHALKLAVVGVTRRLVDDVTRLPLQDRTTAVLIDGSRMSLLALELAGAAWKFGRCLHTASGNRKNGQGSIYSRSHEAAHHNTVPVHSKLDRGLRFSTKGKGGAVPTSHNDIDVFFGKLSEKRFQRRPPFGTRH